MSEYTPRTPPPRPGLRKAGMDPDPFRQFEQWFQEALAARESLVEPTAMTLATASAEGIPSARMVLLKGFDARGFVFYTNYDSLKGRELEQNPHAALVFYWPPLERQVRIAGQAARLPREESEAYFRTRPLNAQLGAWASPQSRVIASREALEQRLAEVEAHFAGGVVPLPPNWGGFRVAPDSFEFWQGRPGRLHDRIRYTRQAGDEWVIERLAP